MYRVLRDSRIILNQHIDMAGDHANNLRLFEATGVGSMLLTDAKADLGELFDEGREVVAYRSASDCRELLDYYLINEDARRAIAAAGQRRTLRDHTYAKRIRELAEMLEGELRRKRRSSATENRDRLVT
jgi:spore maturation protein CgeB